MTAAHKFTHSIMSNTRPVLLTGPQRTHQVHRDRGGVAPPHNQNMRDGESIHIRARSVVLPIPGRRPSLPRRGIGGGSMTAADHRRSFLAERGAECVDISWG